MVPTDRSPADADRTADADRIAAAEAAFDVAPELLDGREGDQAANADPVEPTAN